LADQIDVGPPPVQLRATRSYKGIVVFAVLTVIAAAGFAWFSYGDRLSDLPGFGSSAGSVVAPGSASDNSLVAASEFQAFQQQTSEALQSATQLLTAQQSDLKRLSDEVASLTAKIDLLQNTVASPRPALPPAVASTRPAAPAPVSAAPVAAPAAVAAPRKRPSAPKPAGAISVGGAPLPASTQPIR
jgi:uncharacterized coiled-coil protein SlyX